MSLLNDGCRQLVQALNLDYLFIDTHPGLSKETFLSIAMSNLTLIILRPDSQDFQGTAVTIDVAKQLRVRKMMLLVNKVLTKINFESLKEQVEKIYEVPVATSERTTGSRNRAIAHLMHNFGMIGDKIDETLDLYFQQCSILVNCHDLAVIGATLANKGVNPIAGERAIDSRYVQDVLSLMHSCGMYDYSGE